MDVIFLESVGSTNAFLLERPEQERIGTVVYAASQTSGKGMGANTWESEPGMNLTFSMGVDMSFLKAANQFLLSEAVPLGLLDVLDALTGSLTVKWPNDLLYEGRKLCGILINSTIHGMEMGVSVIGIGLNVNQMQFQDWPTNPISLKMILDRELDLRPLLEQLVSALEKRINQLRTPEGVETIQKEYLNRLFRYHQWGDYQTKEGKTTLYLEGIDTFGRLITLDKSGKEKTYDIKELQFLTPHS